MSVLNHRRQEFIGTPRSSAMLGVLLLTGCCLAAFYGYCLRPPPTASDPSYVLFPSNGGPVLFPHGHHRQDSGAAIECSECHHNYDSTAQAARRCRVCHYDDPDVVETVCADEKIHHRCIGKKCSTTCHDGEKCTFCHRKQP